MLRDPYHVVLHFMMHSELIYGFKILVSLSVSRDMKMGNTMKLLRLFIPFIACSVTSVMSNSLRPY